MKFALPLQWFSGCAVRTVGAFVAATFASVIGSSALYMMNSPFVVDHAKKAAKRVMKLANEDAARVAAAYQLMFARKATEEEVADGTAFLRTYPDSKEPLAAWTAYCQTLFASAEFRYLH